MVAGYFLEWWVYSDMIWFKRLLSSEEEEGVNKQTIYNN